MIYQMKVPKGRIGGKTVGDIIVKELSDAGLECYGRNYRTLFSLVRNQTPTTDNGESGRRKRYYYKEADVRSLCRTLIEEMREIFEEDITA